ncbi:MAG: Gfo/Idh/MocA family oxidoreductase [Opitutaceae bacterium]|nr:Gfo/Idh/MocA family oxidoreductase [Opitutaceae bacterium]
MKLISGFFLGRKVVRWGIVGCGNVTEVKSGPGFQRAERSALVAVMRRNPALAEDYARRHGVPRWYSDGDALICDPEVDAVYIATPPETHLHYALKAAAAGKPAYVEKPMARSTVECDRMIDAFARAGLPLFVAYYRRRMPRFVAVEDLIKAGTLGRITGVDYHQAESCHRQPQDWYVDATAAGGGQFLNMGSHVLDLLDHFFGPLVDVAGIAVNRAGSYLTEDTVALSFRTSGGVPGTVVCNYASAVRDDRLRIAGTEGELTFSMWDSQPLRLETATGVQLLDRPYPPHAQQPLIQSIVDDLLGVGLCPSTGESARRTSRVMDQVLTAYYGGRDDDFWTRPQTWPGKAPESLG